jgi:phosphohistidine swiveling domain-containing protein
VKLLNLPPTAAFTAPSPIMAGSSSQLRLSNPTDFSAADVAAGFRYGFACDSKDSSLPASYFAGSVSATRECSFATAGDYLVKARIFDKDGGQRTYEAIVHVTAPPNQAPSAEAGGPYDVNEGGSVTLHGSGSDPDDDPLTYRWDTDGNGTFETEAQNPTYNAFFLDGPSTRTVTMQACDSHDVCSTDTALVRVANVAPSAVLVAPGLLFEGVSADVSLTSATDPGIADRQAGFRYGFACDGLDASLPVSYAGASTSATVKCNFPQSGSFSVKGRIFDKDGGQRTYAATVVVANQAPVATFVASSPITEGGASQLALIGASDPSPVDVAAGLRFGFACNGLDGSLPQSYAAASTSSAMSCGFPQDGTYTVKGRIFDKDDGQTTYAAVVLVRNQAPVATFINDGPVSEGGGSHISLVDPSDPSPVDTAAGFRYGFACDGNDASLPQAYAAANPANSTLCAFPQSGSFTVKGRIFDQDGGFSTYEQTIVVDNQPPTAAFTAESPVGEGSSSQLVLSNAFDVSAADAATLRFGFACDGLEASLPQSWAAAGAANAVACPFVQDGSYVVKARVFDADGGFSTYEATVVVVNRAPTAVFTASRPSSEGGSSVLALGDAQDPGPVDVAVGLRYGFACDGQDASLPQSYANAGTVASVTCAFGQSGVYTVKGRIFDQDGGINTYEQTIFVANDPPAAVFTATSPINEGSSSLLSLADGSDASAADAAALRYGFACDGREAALPADYESASAVNVAACAFPQDGIYVVKGRVLDPDGGMTTYTATVLVMNVAPTARLTATGPISEGGASVVALEQPFDPGTLDVAAGLHFAFACDGRDASLAETYAEAGLSDRTTCSFPQNGSYTVKGRIFDQDGGMNTYAITVVVENVAPVATFQASSLIPEGSSATLSFANATDPSPADRAAGLRYGFACDGQATSLPQSWATAGTVATISCPFADNGSYQVRGRVFDQDGGFTDYVATVGVQNVAPVITGFTVPTAAQKLTASVPVSATFTDVGRLDTHTVLWQWGDGTSSVGAVNESAGAGTTTASHKYSAPGLYKVTVIVTDKDGGVASASSQWVTVYDGSSDVKGTGTIDLPSTQSCANTCHSSCQKRVGEFTFDSKYRSGQSTPSGSVRFEIDADNLVFRGVTQQWLVVAGATLKLRGTGTVNGKGTYQFLITATDGKLLSRRTTDGFRIKIWNASTGAVIFDNRPGLDDEVNDTQTIRSGDVAIYR